MIARLSTILMLLLFTISLAAAQEEEIIEYLPTPTGPYQIGSTYRHWIDESRDETLTDAPDDKRELMVRFWYPADVAEDAVPMPPMPNAEIQMPLISVLLPVAGARPKMIGTPSHTYLDAPLAESDTRFPVLVFSHAPYTVPEMFTAQMEELASHGYVVAAPYHTYISPATVFPDGRVAGHVSIEHEIMADDLLFVMDQLELLDAEDPEGFFTGRLQTEGFGVFGMSGGARAADMVCRSDARCTAYVNEDADRTGIVTVEQVPPAMFMSAKEGTALIPYQVWRGPAYGLRFPAFVHVSFSDAPLFPVMGAPGGIPAVQSVNAYLVAFFDTYLKGEPSPLLDGPSEDFPDVEFESRNTD